LAQRTSTSLKKVLQELKKTPMPKYDDNAELTTNHFADNNFDGKKNQIEAKKATANCSHG
jgi:hypothetical protein